MSRQIWLFAALFVSLTAFAFFLLYHSPTEKISSAVVLPASDNAESLLSKPIAQTQANIKYGFVLDNYQVTEDAFKKNEFLSDVLLRHHVPYPQIDKVVQKAKDIFDVRKMRVGKNYMILAPKKANEPAQYLIYEPSPFQYVIYNLQDSATVQVVERPVQTVVNNNSGVIESSLWNAIVDNGMSYAIADKMEDALAWSVDFHHIQKGDKFKLVYEELFIEGEKVGIGKIQAAYFKNGSKEFNAYYFESDQHKGYFDAEGRPMKKAFLQAPLKFSRISSPFNMKRFHPILRRVKPHLGTDYAAPYGTPILAVADGTVLKAERSGGNGNYVKIRHDKVYETQYLHMQRFAKGIRSGVRVRQGEVIGYVGSTGLATGPHVCFRFWKNGVQVDHRKENLPPPEPIDGESMKAFIEIRDQLKAQLDKIEYKKMDKNGKIVDP